MCGEEFTMDYFEHKKRRRYIEQAEKEGRVADSLEVRMNLIARVKAGKITFNEMQEELERIKRNAKKNGQVTRAQAYSGA